MASRLKRGGGGALVLASMTMGLASPVLGQGGLAPPGPGQGTPPAAPGISAPVAAVGDGGPGEEGLRPPPWQFQAILGLSETVTDHAGGIGGGRTGTGAAATTAGGADLISRVSPGIRLLHDGNRGQLTFGYSANYDKYARNSELDGLRHNLLGSGTAEIWRDLLFLRASATVSEELIDSRGPTTATSRAVDGNEATVASFIVSPLLRSRLGGGFAVGELRYNYGFTSASGSGTSDGQINLVGARLGSGPDFQRVLWSVTAETSKIEGGSNTTGGIESETKRRLARFDAGYVLDRNVTLLAGIGYEQVENPTLARDRIGLIYNVGFELTPGPRTKLRLTYNDRYDTNFVEVDGTYQLTESSQVRLTYGETIATAQEQRFSNLGNISRSADGSLLDSRTGVSFGPLNPGFGANNGFGDTAFRQKRGALGFTWGLSNLYSALLSYEERVGETTSTSQTSYTASLGFARPLSERASFSSSVGYQRIEDDGTAAALAGGRKENTYRATAALTYDLGPTVKTGVSYAFALRDSADSGTDHENSLTLRLSKTF